MTDPPKKDFFRERTPAQITKLSLLLVDEQGRDLLPDGTILGPDGLPLSLREARGPEFRGPGLVSRLLNVNPSKEALLLGSNLHHSTLTDPRYKRVDSTWATRKMFRKSYIPVNSKVRTLERAIMLYHDGVTPSDLRKEALSRVSKIPEEYSFFVGFSNQPVQGANKSFGLVNLWAIMVGAGIFVYTKQAPRNDGLAIPGPVNIEMDFSESERIPSKDGAVTNFSVPSTTSGRRRYNGSIYNIPIEDNELALPIALGTHTSWNSKFDPPKYLRWVKNFSFRDQSHSSNDFDFWLPHSVAGDHASVEHLVTKHGNVVPHDYSIIPIPSRFGVYLWLLSRNNLLVHDPDYSSGSKKFRNYRHARVGESSVLVMRAVANPLFGHDMILHCDPSVDGKLRDYPWGIPGINGLTLDNLYSKNPGFQ